MKDLSKLYDYYYVIKKPYRKKVEKEYNTSDDKINYNNIKNSDELYSLFIQKVLYLFYNSTINTDKIIEIKNLLESRYLLDRLRGLKLSKLYIKGIDIEVEGDTK